MSNITGLTGTVRWFDKSSGEGMIREETTGRSFWVYGCNIQGAKTGFPHTACAYLVDGEPITFDLCDFGDHWTAVNVGGAGVRIDNERWASMDKSRLAFVKADDGSFVNGLFGGAK